MPVSAPSPAEPARSVAELIQASESAGLRGDYSNGANLAEQAVKLAKAEGDCGGQAVALRVFAHHQGRIGLLEASIRACEGSATLLRELGDDSGLCQTLLVEAFFYLELGLHEEALETLGECRALASARQDQTQLYWIHNRLGIAHSYIGDHERADDYLRKALQQAEDIDDVALFSAVNNLVDNLTEYVPQLREDGEQAFASAKLVAGLGNADRAVELARKLGNPHLESMALSNRAVLRGLNGEYDAAIKDLADSRGLAIAHGYRSLERATVQYEGSVSLWRGDNAAAVVLLERAVDLAIAENELPAQLLILEQLSQAYENLEQYKQALRAHKQFRAMELKVKSSRADTRARLLAGQLDVDKVKLETDVATLQRRTEQLQHAALSDVLTGIGNRRYLEDVLPTVLADAQSGGRDLCVALLDIDHFKHVNDTYGHGIGDDVLARVAQLILGDSRAADILGRLGGEEFLIAFVDADLNTATNVAERIRRNIEAENWTLIRPGMAVTISIGIAASIPADRLSDVISRADEQMYRAKAAGRNRVCATAPEPIQAPARAAS